MIQNLVLKRHRLRPLLLSATVLATMSGISAAHAQTAPPTDEQSAPVAEQEEAPAAQSGGDIVVTGSRVITNGNDSPTPLTTVQVDQLAATTPSNIPDGLNKLPVFTGSRTQRTTGGSTINWPGNYLNLRRIGTNRTLILLDGMRVPYTDSSGNVDVNSLPQGLMERVDVVTGGASAVYGSDAVTGVVNFILDKRFNGLEASAQGGISQQGDDFSWRASLNAGTELFGGRGHIEGSYEHYHSDGIDSMSKRPLGDRAFQMIGGGTAANPYRLAEGARSTNLTPGGYIGAGPLANMTFSSNGVLTPFVHGTPVSGVLELGGDGGWSGQGYKLFPGSESNPWLAASLTTDRVFARFDYNVTDNINWFVQGNYSFAENYNISGVKSITNIRFMADNAFLPASARTALGATPSFLMSKAFHNEIGDVSNGITNSYNVMTGFTGKLFGDFNFDVHYTHGWSQLHERAPDTLNYQKLFAAVDAVTNSAGQVVCRATLNPTGAALYAGCQPLNAFGPSAESASAFDYITDDTEFRTTNIIDDVAFSVSGPLFQGWAGPVRGAVSGEYRNVSLQVQSDFAPTARVDCTGQNAAVCETSRAVWNGVVANRTPVSQNVKEIAGEIEFPLLRDIPLIKELNLNGAVRYTDYSTSGGVTTWKIGGIWEVFSDLKFRATKSRDIRAPNLNDLFAPTNQNFTAFTDFQTGVTGTTTTVSRGNPDLRPEVSDTLSVGAIYSPSWLPGFSASVDYYRINITDLISSIGGGNTVVQQICLASGGSSPYCALSVRPISSTDRSAGNYPSQIINSATNIGYLKTNGVDIELGYRFNAPALFGESAKVDLRALVSYQPNFKTFNGLPGSPILNAAGNQSSGTFGLADKRATFMVGYESGPFNIDFQGRYHGATGQTDNSSLIYTTGKVPAFFYLDMGLRYQITGSGEGRKKKGIEAFVSIENLLNRDPAIFIGTGRTGAPGYAYPASFDEDVIGRYVTLGVRIRM